MSNPVIASGAVRSPRGNLFLKRWSLPSAALYILLATMPLGTRLLFRQGSLGGAPVEWGTLSLYATQTLALAVIIGAAASSVQAHRHGASFRGPVIPAFALAAFATVAVLWSPDLFYAATVAGWIVLGLLLLLALRAVRPDPRMACLALVAGASFQAALGLWQTLTQRSAASTALGIAPHAVGDLGAFVVETASGRWLRAYGTLPHPNVLGAVLVLGIVAAVTMAPRCHARLRLAVSASLPLMTAAVFFTYSRSAWLGLFVAILVLLAGNRKRILQDAHVRRVMSLSCATMVATAGMLAMLNADAVFTRISGEGRLEQRSLQERQTQFADAWDLLKSRGASGFLGVGPGQMPSVLARHAEAAGEPREGWAYQPIHNVPALIAVELGIIGLAAWLWSAIAAFTAVRPRGDDRDMERAAFRAMFIGLLVMGLFDHYLWSLWVGQLFFWSVAGLLWSFEE